MHVVDGTVCQCNDVLRCIFFHEEKLGQRKKRHHLNEVIHHRMLLSSIMHEPKYKVPEPLLYSIVPIEKEQRDSKVTYLVYESLSYLSTAEFCLLYGN